MIHFGGEMFQVVFDIILIEEVERSVEVVEPLRVYLEEFFALFQLLHLFRLHKGNTPLVGMNTLRCHSS